ncbi:MAG TPA: PAS domain S-box protein, partial [Allocoleopsis sp.]
MSDFLRDALLNLSTDAIFVADTHRCLIEVNARACQLLGYHREELLGRSIAHFIPSVAFSSLLPAPTSQEQQPPALEHWTYLHKDGHPIPTTVRAQVLPDGCWVALVQVQETVKPDAGVQEQCQRDQQQAEYALREKERQLQHLSDSIPQFVWIRDAQGQLTYVNRQWCEYSGLSLEQSQDRTQRAECYHPDDRTHAFEQWGLALDAKQPFEFEARLKRAEDGTYRWFLIRGVPVWDEQGQVLHWYGISTDIHDRKITELNERFLSDLDLRLR